LGLLVRLFGGKGPAKGEDRDPSERNGTGERDPKNEQLEELRRRLIEMREFQDQFMEFRSQLENTAEEILTNKNLSREERDRRMKEVEERVAEVLKMEKEFSEKMTELKKRSDEIRKREFA